MQAIETPQALDTGLAGDLYALIVFLHKNCNADLFEALGALDLSLTQVKLLHHLEDQPREITLKEAAESVHVSLPAGSRMVDDLVRQADHRTSPAGVGSPCAARTMRTAG